jgi:hypothetical protein
MQDTLDRALADIFTGFKPSVPSGTGPVPAPASETVRRLGGEAWKIFQDGQERLRRGDWEGYGRTVRQLEDVLKRIKDQEK